MKADWTRSNPEIGAYLASYGRYGIPFNIVYGPAAPGGIVLPEALTPDNVADALSKAGGAKAALGRMPARQGLCARLDAGQGAGSSPVEPGGQWPR